MHLAGTMTAEDVMMQGAAFAQRNADQIALGGIGRLADRLRYLARLAVTEADPALAEFYARESKGEKLSDEEAAVWKAEKRRWEAERCCPEDSLQSPEKAK